VSDVTVQPVEHVTVADGTSKSFKMQARFMAELDWIKRLQTPYPLGLNDSIYQQGNISNNPDIDIFSILSLRKRKRRSHGQRKNHNIKRRSRISLSVLELHKIFKSSGRHSLLSRLTTLSVSSLKKLDDEADNIYLRTNPLYEVAGIIQSYTRHILRPHIDSESEHVRHFLKISYINKGIDFIDLASIFKDKRVVDKIPKYFKSLEPPMICYKYKKSTRNLIFNYNKIVSDLDIETTNPTD
jgi:hypothetical protein